MQKSRFFHYFFMFYNIFFIFVLFLVHCEPLEVASLPVYTEMTLVADWYKTFWMLNLVVEEFISVMMK